MYKNLFLYVIYYVNLSYFGMVVVVVRWYLEVVCVLSPPPLSPLEPPGGTLILAFEPYTMGDEAKSLVPILLPVGRVPNRPTN